MKQTALHRYDKTDEGDFIIDVAASKVEDLYNNFDKSSPYIRRDLDTELGQYLFDSVKELRNEPFIIRFTLAEAPGNEKESRVRTSINAYFQYLCSQERQKLMIMFRKAAILFFVGLAILFLSVTVYQGLDEDYALLTEVFAHGLTVAAWVSLWNSFAVVLIEWLPYRRNINYYERLANATISFRMI